MKNPCRRECPERTPGCHCEKREAWKFYQKQIKDARKREANVSAYQRDAVYQSRKASFRRKHRV